MPLQHDKSPTPARELRQATVAVRRGLGRLEGNVQDLVEKIESVKTGSPVINYWRRTKSTVNYVQAHSLALMSAAGLITGFWIAKKWKASR